MAKKIKSFTVDEEAYKALMAPLKGGATGTSFNSSIDNHPHLFRNRPRLLPEVEPSALVGIGRHWSALVGVVLALIRHSSSRPQDCA